MRKLRGKDRAPFIHPVNTRRVRVSSSHGKARPATYKNPDSPRHASAKLAVAAGENDVSGVLQCLKQLDADSDIDALCYTGNQSARLQPTTSLCEAVLHGAADSVLLLLEYNAKPNQVGVLEWPASVPTTPLALAAAADAVGICTVLLQSKAYPHFNFGLRLSPLRSGHAPLVAGALFEIRGDDNIFGIEQQVKWYDIIPRDYTVELRGLRSKSGQTLNGHHGVLVRYYPHKKRFSVRVKGVHELQLLRAANLRKVCDGKPHFDAIGSTTIVAVWQFVAAASNNDITTVLDCLQSGTGVNSTCCVSLHDGFNALTTAVSRGSYDIVDLLLKSRADIDSCTTEHGSPLHLAADRDTVAIAARLIEARANPRQEFPEYKVTPFQIATEGLDSRCSPLVAALFMDGSDNGEAGKLEWKTVIPERYKVEFRDLNTKVGKRLNGKQGFLLNFHPEKMRFSVNAKDCNEPVLVRAINLRVVYDEIPNFDFKISSGQLGIDVQELPGEFRACFNLALSALQAWMAEVRKDSDQAFVDSSVDGERHIVEVRQLLGTSTAQSSLSEEERSRSEVVLEVAQKELAAMRGRVMRCSRLKHVAKALQEWYCAKLHPSFLDYDDDMDDFWDELDSGSETDDDETSLLAWRRDEAWVGILSKELEQGVHSSEVASLADWKHMMHCIQKSSEYCSELELHVPKGSKVFDAIEHLEKTWAAKACTNKAWVAYDQAQENVRDEFCTARRADVLSQMVDFRDGACSKVCSETAELQKLETATVASLLGVRDTLLPLLNILEIPASELAEASADAVWIWSDVGPFGLRTALEPALGLMQEKLRGLKLRLRNCLSGFAWKLANCRRPDACFYHLGFHGMRCCDSAAEFVHLRSRLRKIQADWQTEMMEPLQEMDSIICSCSAVLYSFDVRQLLHRSKHLSSVSCEEKVKWKGKLLFAGEAAKKARRRVVLAKRGLEDAEDDADEQAIVSAKASVKAARQDLWLHERDEEKLVMKLWQLCDAYWPELEIDLQQRMSARVVGACRSLGRHGQHVQSVLRPRSRNEYDGPAEILSKAAARHRVEVVAYAGEECVLKRFEFSCPHDEHLFLKEVSLHQRLAHRNVLPVRVAFLDESYGYLQFDRHPCDIGHWASHGLPGRNSGGILSDVLTVPGALDVLQQMACAVEHLHQLNVVHGDIKPSNYVISETHTVLLFDFELCNQAGAETTTVLTALVGGTAHFLAPELCIPGHGNMRIRDPQIKATLASDIYALGQALAEVSCGAAVKQVLTSDIAQHINQLACTCRGNASNRPSASEVAQSDVFKITADIAKNKLWEESVPQAPFYWWNKTLMPGFQRHESGFVRNCVAKLLQVKSGCQCSSKGCRKEKPLHRWHVSNTWRVENTWLFQAYCNKKSEYLARCSRYNINVEAASKQLMSLPQMQTSLDTSLNEVYLLHGCCPSAASTILQAGLDERVSHHKGLYGAGIYMTSQACKALQYARGDDCSIHRKKCNRFWCDCDGPRNILVVRVLLADILYASPDQQLTGARRPPLVPGLEHEGVTFSSVVALPGIANSAKQEHVEAVVFSGAQCYVEYLIELQRT